VTEPSVRPRSHLAPLLAVVVALIMVGGAFLVFGTAAGAPAPAGVAGPPPAIAPNAVTSGSQLQQSPFTQLAGAPLSDLANATVLGPAPLSQPMMFTVGFPMQNESELAEIIAEQGTPGSPMYQKPLTLAQESRMFGPNPVEVQNVVNYFTSLGFRVGTVGPISVSFEAPVASINSAFHTQLSDVSYGNATARNMTVANSQPLSLPMEVAAGVDAIDGLSGMQYQVYHSQLPGLAQILGGAADLAPSAVPANGTANLAALSYYQNEAFAYFVYYSHTYGKWYHWDDISAPAFNNLFDANPLINAGYNGNSTGKPITIAIVMGGGINPDDIRAFSQLTYDNPNQIMNRLVPTPVDGAFILNGSLYYTDGASNEMALDIEESSTMAPGARIMPVYGPNLFANYLDDDYATIDQMTTIPNIISNSWGGPEDTSATLYNPGVGNDLTMDHYYMLIDARGGSVIASSGDGGGFDGTTGILSGSFPASDPYVMSVDGLRTVPADPYGIWLPQHNLTVGLFQTDLPILGLKGINQNLWVTKAASIHNQSYWYEPITNLSLYTGPPSGSGGFGLSYWFDQPYWEHGISVPDVGRSLGSGVAAEGDYNMSIFFDGTFEYLYGGTSFACPTTAGMLADIEDYLLAHGHSPYLFNVNQPVYQVANAWENGNLTADPFYGITNGTSFWGNHGAQFGYSWPPGQNFPTSADGAITYGDTTPGWNFPTGWGSINVYNFAVDLLQLESEPGTFMTVNATTNTYAPAEWQSLTLNQTYTIDVNATAAIGAADPTVQVEYIPQLMTGVQGTPVTMTVPTTPAISPSTSLRFTLNTGAAPFSPKFSPGVLIFTLGDDALANASHKNLGFSYDWLAPSIPAGHLTVTVVNPTRNAIVGGCADANALYAVYFDPPYIDPGPACQSIASASLSGILYENTFTVKVTNQAGQPVYNALVTATVPNPDDVAYANSYANVQTTSQGRTHSLISPIISQTFTNLTGYALVYTWNMVAPTPYFVNATYGPESGGTVYTVSVGPNVAPWDAGGGKYSELNTVGVMQYVFHVATTNQSMNAWVPNSVNESGLYDIMYGWQGERVTVRVNDYQGNPMGSTPVWLGTYDTGHEYKFVRYNPSGGIVGVTNSSGTTNITNSQGFATIQIPDNESDTNYFGSDNIGLGIAAIAANITSGTNRTFQYSEKCSPNLPNPSLLINCQFNNSYERSYTATPMIIMPNPVNVTTMTPAHVAWNFFKVGAPVAFRVNVSLPTESPELQWYFNIPYGNEWYAGLEHITSITSYVDGAFVGNLTPVIPPNLQVWSAYSNLSQTYGPGIHELTLVITTSLGQTFTDTHRFIVGAIVDEDLSSTQQYTTIPYNLTWAVDVPAAQVSNTTFNSSLEILYLTPSGCGGSQSTCVVVNYSIRVNPHQVTYSQSINQTLLGLDGFYSGAGVFPQDDEYEAIIWFSANHSGSITQGVATNFIFSPLTGVINGPAANSKLPVGQTTISYTYTGAFLSNATIEVLQPGITLPIFSQGAFIPGVGGEPRSGAANWTSVSAGKYQIVLLLGAPYATNSTSEWINVTANSVATVTPGGPHGPLISVSAASLALVLALIAGIVGILLGLWVSPALRPSQGAKGTGPKEWEGAKPGMAASAGGPVTAAGECSICHERFETAFGLHQHQKVVHGLEE
jgi:hypothetical protein